MLTSEPAHAIVTYRTVALEGQLAPGTDLGITYNFFNPPVINERGETAFTAGLSQNEIPIGTYQRAGIWSEGGNQLHLVARENEQAPGTAHGVTFSSIPTTLSFNALGQVAFSAILSGPGVNFFTNSIGIWSEKGGSLELVAREADPAPGTGPSVIFANPGRPTIGNHGQVAFNSSLTGAGVNTSNSNGVWSESDGTLTLLIRAGQNAPEAGPGVVFTDLGDPTFNRNLDTTFVARLGGIGVSNDRSIWSGNEHYLSMIAREGQPAPGVAVGLIYTDFSLPVINANGQIMFLGSISGPSVDQTNNTGIWSESAGSLKLVARSGDQAPGTDPGVIFNFQFNNYPYTPSFNSRGETALLAGLSGPGVDNSNHTGIWVESGSDLALVARTGDPAPGTETGTVYEYLGSPMLNARGYTVFNAHLTGPGINHTNDGGLWTTAPNGITTLIVREGDLFDVNDDPEIDELLVVDYILLSDNSAPNQGGVSFFNDNGQIAFQLDFTDGSSGIFVATLGIPGDLDGDGFVGINDLNLVLENWNQTVPPGDALADANGDNFIGIEDLNAVLGNWNAGTPPTDQTNIPEPATALICLTGLILLHRRAG